jgi:hypothetical protein
MIQVDRTQHESALRLLRGSVVKQTNPMSMINERIALCRGTERSNCIGTSLYIAGEKDKDEFHRLSEAYESLMNLTKLPNPTCGCLIAWHYHHLISAGECGIYTVHMGVVTSINPLLVTSRDGCMGKLIEDEPFEDTTKPYTVDYKIASSIAYYLPTLQRLSKLTTKMEFPIKRA